MRISVIIPARNEERVIAAALKSARTDTDAELIVVDGESTDGTSSVARTAGATVITSKANRALQMNAGARAAVGEVLLFLHADTCLPENYGQYIRRAVVEDSAVGGAFRLGIAGPGMSLRIIETAANIRSRWCGMPFGDQGIFMTAETFRDSGGFPDVPIMEDFIFIRGLRKRGRIVILPVTVATSSRRWRERGPWKNTVVNQMASIAYFLGVPLVSIARWYHRDKGASS